jgi:hypothetical protein
MDKVKISKSEYNELLQLKRNETAEKNYRNNYYKNKYANDPNFRERRRLANKKYNEKKKLEKLKKIENKE